MKKSKKKQTQWGRLVWYITLLIGLAVFMSSCLQPVTEVPTETTAEVVEDEPTVTPATLPVPAETESYVSDEVPTGKVCAKTLYVRDTPGIEHPPVRHVGKGERVTIFALSDGWVRISPLDDDAEWVNADYLC